jgi:hypothetical protein
MTAGRPLVLCFLAAGVLHAAAARSAELALEAYDLRKCVQWSISPAPQPVRSAAYRAAKARARSGLEVFTATAELPEGGSLRKYGACSFRRVGGKPRLGCVAVLDFPLAGATYVLADVQRLRSATMLRCASGCDQKIPDTVYELHESADDAAQDKEERARGARFRRACAHLR